MLTALPRFTKIVERSPELIGLHIEVFNRIKQVLHNAVHDRLRARIALAGGALVNGLEQRVDGLAVHVCLRVLYGVGVNQCRSRLSRSIRSQSSVMPRPGPCGRCKEKSS